MKRNLTAVLLAFAGALLLSGCLVRSYPLVRERVDQDLSAGNRGFLAGSKTVDADRKTTRTTQVVEVEMGKRWKFERRPAMTEQKAPAAADQAPLEEERFYRAPAEPTYIESAVQPEPAPEPVAQAYQEYVVQKGDTLQKISDRFFGTTKKWHKIYQANKDVLKSPDKLRAGQVIRIPVEQGAGKIK